MFKRVKEFDNSFTIKFVPHASPLVQTKDAQKAAQEWREKMNREAVKEWICQFIKENLGVTIDENISLLDPANGLMPRDLLVLFFEIEKKYSVTLLEKDVLERRFDYVEDMTDAVLFKM